MRRSGVRSSSAPPTLQVSRMGLKASTIHTLVEVAMARKLLPVSFLLLSLLPATLSAAETERCLQLEPAADLSACDFSGRNLAGKDLAATNLTGAKLEKTDLRGANLKWANLARARLRKADLREADLFHAILDAADVSGAQFGKANLFGANLIGTKAVDADFAGAYLKDVLMEGIDLTGGSLADTYMLRGVLTDRKSVV